MFSSDDEDLAFIILFVLIVLIAMNAKFLLHWSFYMVYTFAHKYKLMHSVFMILGIGKENLTTLALCKRHLAEKMLDQLEAKTPGSKYYS
jgi:hypothetical protein